MFWKLSEVFGINGCKEQEYIATDQINFYSMCLSLNVSEYDLAMPQTHT